MIPDAAERLFPALSEAPKGIDLYARTNSSGAEAPMTQGWVLAVGAEPWPKRRRQGLAKRPAWPLSDVC